MIGVLVGIIFVFIVLGAVWWVPVAAERQRRIMEEMIELNRKINNEHSDNTARPPP